MGCQCFKEADVEENMNLARKENFRWAEVSKCLNTGDLVFLRTAVFDDRADEGGSSKYYWDYVAMVIKEDVVKTGGGSGAALKLLELNTNQHNVRFGHAQLINAEKRLFQRSLDHPGELAYEEAAVRSFGNINGSQIGHQKLVQLREFLMPVKRTEEEGVFSVCGHHVAQGSGSGGRLTLAALNALGYQVLGENSNVVSVYNPDFFAGDNVQFEDLVWLNPLMHIDLDADIEKSWEELYVELARYGSPQDSATAKNADPVIEVKQPFDPNTIHELIASQDKLVKKVEAESDLKAREKAYERAIELRSIFITYKKYYERDRLDTEIIDVQENEVIALRKKILELSAGPQGNFRRKSLVELNKEALQNPLKGLDLKEIRRKSVRAFSRTLSRTGSSLKQLISKDSSKDLLNTGKPIENPLSKKEPTVTNGKLEAKDDSSDEEETKEDDEIFHVDENSLGI